MAGLMTNHRLGQVGAQSSRKSHGCPSRIVLGSKVFHSMDRPNFELRHPGNANFELFPEVIACPERRTAVSGGVNNNLPLTYRAEPQEESGKSARFLQFSHSSRQRHQKPPFLQSGEKPLFLLCPTKFALSNDHQSS